MEKEELKMVQIILERMGLDPGPVDGIMGPGTRTALEKVPGFSSDWTINRRAVGVIQMAAEQRGIDGGAVDGYWGPQTQFAYGCLVEMVVQGQEPEPWRPEDRAPANPRDWPSQAEEAELIRFFGNPGDHLIQVDLPYPHRIAWNTDQVVNRITCHEKVGPSLVKILGQVREHYHMEGILALGLDLWGGCYNKRRMRGGRRWSMHAWGIAMDYDPARNQLKWGSDRAVFARSEYRQWWRFWEAEGWVSLGRARNFDWMHVQAARL